MIETDVPFLRFFLFAGGLLFFLAFELANPYRPSSVSKVTRWLNNLGITLFNSMVLHLLFSGAIIVTAGYVERHGIGVLNIVTLASWSEVLVTVALLDFMLYIWHLLNHEIPFFWRFHRVHHSDLNMDASTATRFHIGELAISMVIKVSLIFFLGANALSIVVFESAIVLCAQFQHSSLKVPRWFESLYWLLFVPPSMHRIHHSVIIRERDTNYGTIFSVWDRILGTLIKDIHQDGIRIGLGAYQKPGKLNLHHLLVMPFMRPVK